MASLPSLPPFPCVPRGLSWTSSSVEESAAQALKGLLAGAWVAQAVFATAKLGIADLLQDGPKTATDLATLSGAHASSLHWLLRALPASVLLPATPKAALS